MQGRKSCGIAHPYSNRAPYSPRGYIVQSSASTRRISVVFPSVRDMFGDGLKKSEVIIVEDGRGNSGVMSWELRSQRLREFWKKIAYR